MSFSSLPSSPIQGWTHLGPTTPFTLPQTHSTTSIVTPILPPEVIARIFLHHNDLRSSNSTDYKVISILTSCKAFRDEYLPLLYSTVVITRTSQFRSFLDFTLCSSWKWIETLDLQFVNNGREFEKDFVEWSLTTRRLALLVHSRPFFSALSGELNDKALVKYKAAVVPRLCNVLCSVPSDTDVFGSVNMLSLMLQMTQPQVLEYRSERSIHIAITDWSVKMPSLRRVEWVGDLYWCPWTLHACPDESKEQRRFEAIFSQVQRIDLVLLEPDLNENYWSDLQSDLQMHLDQLHHTLKEAPCLELMSVNLYLVKECLWKAVRDWAEGKDKIKVYCDRRKDYSYFLKEIPMTHEEVLAYPRPDLPDHPVVEVEARVESALED